MHKNLRIALTLMLPLMFVAYAGAEEGSFDSAGVKIHYTDQGRGEPVLLIHGFTAGGGAWAMAGTVAALASDYRVITMDCRGHGKSGKPHDPASYGLEMVEDVVRLLNHLKIARSHVVGFSMGGMITLKLVATHPDRVISAVPAGFGWPSPDGPHGTAFFVRLAESLENGTGLAPLISALTPPGQPPPAEDQIAAINLLILARNDPKALAAVVRGFDRLSVTESELRANRVPTLTLIGGNDPLKTDVDRMIGVMGNHRVEVIEGANHAQTGFRPEFVQHIKSFLVRQAKPARKAG